jgi:hypothetical protein
MIVAALCGSAAVALAASTGPEPAAGARSHAGQVAREQESRQGPEQTERFTHTAKVGDGAALDLANVSGDVRVTAGPGREIRIEAIKRVRHRDAAEARRLLGELRIEVNQVGDRLEVRTRYPRRSGEGRSIPARVDYTIAVPAESAATIRSISGAVNVTGVRGEVRAETVSGDVDVSSAPNLALAKTISGDVRARDIGAPSMLTLGTVSGTVTAVGLKGRTLECGSVSGELQLSSIAMDRVVAKTVSGGIAFEGPLHKAGRYQFSGHSGDIRLALVGDTGFELDADTFSGSVRSDYPIAERSSGDSRRQGRAASRTVRGTYGDGSAVLVVHSFSGSVVILRK